MHEVITSDQAPAAIGTYSQAIKSGNTVYISGQIALIPATMQIHPGNFTDHVKQIIQNLSAIAEKAGGSLNHIVKLTIYLTNMNDYPMVNQAMKEAWPQPFPARAAIAVAGLPKNVNCEMDAIMCLGEET